MVSNAGQPTHLISGVSPDGVKWKIFEVFCIPRVLFAGVAAYAVKMLIFTGEDDVTAAAAFTH